ncbi:hypothetical protein C7S14_7396 [Burkholderia cepacia]|nr:hypothetical protein C7S14_7396 [Burkholderia cepacia]
MFMQLYVSAVRPIVVRAIITTRHIETRKIHYPVVRMER